MSDRQHAWEMTNIEFGFIIFEKCYQTGELRTTFSTEDHPILGDRYREGEKHWTVVEIAQSFSFDLKDSVSGTLEKYDTLMGLMHCTGCMPDCELDIQRKKYEAEKTWIVIAFGYLPEAVNKPFPQKKLDILTDYFNQRRDTSRSRIKVLPFTMIKDLPRCRGDFILDVGMLSKEAPPKERTPVF